jgi:hypothetical protein
VGARIAVLALGVGEAALPKAGALERLRDPLDLDDVDADLQRVLRGASPPTLSSAWSLAMVAMPSRR